MTIIAWDGKSLAVDKMSYNHGLGETVKKYRVLADGSVIAWCGDNEQGLMLADWYESGADRKDWPEFQKTDDWTRFVIANKLGVKFYEKEPVAQVMEEQYQAWGSGRDYALGAMAMGADAKKAVLIASSFNVYCGKGVEVFHFNKTEINAKTANIRSVR